MIDGYKRGGKVKKGKKVKKVKKVKKDGRRKSTAKRALPPLTTGTLGTGTGSYQATIGTGTGSGGAFQAPSYFRAVGSSQEYGVVPPVLREFIEQQKKMLDDIKKKSPPALPPSSAPASASAPASTPAPVSSSYYSSSGQVRRGTGASSILSSAPAPSYFPPASGASMNPKDVNIDSPSSNYVPLRASRPDDLSASASMASAVASYASSSAMTPMSSIEASDVEGKEEARDSEEESVNIPEQVLPKIKIPRTEPGQKRKYRTKKMKEQEELERQERERQEREALAPSSPRTAMRRGIARLDALQASGAF